MEGEKTDAVPFEWSISRVCEEFNCLPSVALKELMNDPMRMAVDIMELRAYARAKEILDNARSDKEIPDNPMIDRVFEIQAELLKRRKENGRRS